MGEKTREKKIFQKNRFRKQIIMEKNRLEKVRKQVFYKHTNIVTKKMGGKKREKFFFPETHVYREIKTMEKKSSGKSAKTRFL